MRTKSIVIIGFGLLKSTPPEPGLILLKSVNGFDTIEVMYLSLIISS